jgi:translation initiation factor 5B
LIDTYTQWVDDDSADLENSMFSELTPISKFTFLKGYIFRNSNPAVFGIRVDVGTLRQKISFMNKTGKKIGVIHQLQHENKTVETAKTGQEVACSVQNITIGRQIQEEDVFYTLPPPDDAKQYLNKFKNKLSSEELHTLNEIVEIIRVKNPIYGY